MTDPDTQTPLLDNLTALPPANLRHPIRIYVACLAAYNNGHLHGSWIDASQGEAHIWEQSQAMLKASPEPHAEEWAIHDYEGFEGVNLSEYASFKTVSGMAEFIEEHGKLGAELVSHYGGDLEDAKKRMEEYLGEYSSLDEQKKLGLSQMRKRRARIVRITS